MTLLQLRNRVRSLLSGYLNIPIVLSDQTDEEPPMPYGVYSVLNYRAVNSDFGDHHLEAAGDNLLDIREEQVQATFSFNFISQNREEDGVQILGDDEACELVERAVGYFNHAGYHDLCRAGVVVNNILDVGNRSALEIDEVPRQYGFDVEIRYGRRDVLPLETIGTCAIQKE